MAGLIVFVPGDKALFYINKKHPWEIIIKLLHNLINLKHFLLLNKEKETFDSFFIVSFSGTVMHKAVKYVICQITIMSVYD